MNTHSHTSGIVLEQECKFPGNGHTTVVSIVSAWIGTFSTQCMHTCRYIFFFTNPLSSVRNTDPCSISLLFILNMHRSFIHIKAHLLNVFCNRHDVLHFIYQHFQPIPAMHCSQSTKRFILTIWERGLRHCRDIRNCLRQFQHSFFSFPFFYYLFIFTAVSYFRCLGCLVLYDRSRQHSSKNWSLCRSLSPSSPKLSPIFVRLSWSSLQFVSLPLSFLCRSRFSALCASFLWLRLSS